MSNPLAVPGTNVPASSLITPGGATGVQGITGASGPSTPSTQAGNLLTTGADSLLYLPASQIQPTIWSVRLRGFSSVGNPTFECNQRQPATTVGTGTFPLDRWSLSKAGMATGAATGSQTAGLVTVPGTNFLITGQFLRITLTAQQATLATGDMLWLTQYVEGPLLRELINDVHSVSVLVRSSVANLNFGVALNDAPGHASLTKLCSLSSAATWTLIPLANLPIWGAAGTWPITPGTNGYQFSICLAAGTTYMSPANDSWQSGLFLGAVGQSNFAASPVNSTFDIAFCQHEPGALCTTLIDCPFTDNLRACKRYFAKSDAYGTKPPSSNIATLQSVPNFSAANGMQPFEVELAKAPVTLNIYNGTTINQAYQNGTGAVTVTSASATSKGIYALALSANIPANNFNGIMFGYTADTGW